MTHPPRRALLQNLLALAACAALPGAALAAEAASVQPAGKPAPVQVAFIEALSGPFANTGESVWRNLLMASERVNARGGAQIELRRYDNKGQVDESLAALRAAIDHGARVVLQGNSSAVAAALVDAINKHNRREPERQVLFLNYSAIDPALTNERCSPWHFRFDAHADMRMAALMQVIKEDKDLKRIYLIGQDYSFGQAVLREARRQLEKERPGVQIVGDELHPVGRVKDFAPYAAKIKNSGAQAVLTGNWGNDLTLLVKAVREAGFDGRFYTFYGNALGAPAAIGEAGIGKVFAVADWMPNVPAPESAAFYKAFRERFPKPEDDYVHLRQQLLIEALAQAIDTASKRPGGPTAANIAASLENAKVQLAGRSGHMRAQDHQFQQNLVVGVMDKQGAPGVPFDVEGSGYGFRIVRDIPASEAEMPTTCAMQRPWQP